MNIILLTGPAGSGKSTASEYLHSQHRYCREKFAAPLKEFCYEYLGLTYQEVEGVLKESPLERYNNRSPRTIMQTLGTDWGRWIDPDIWVKVAINNIREKIDILPSIDRFCFDDTRFPNEIELLQEAFPDNVKVVNIVPEFEGYKVIEASGHASETQELPWDYQIINKGILQDFYEQMEAVLTWD